MEWFQSEYDRKMKFERYFFRSAEGGEALASINRVPTPEGEPERWCYCIFGEVDDQDVPEGYSDPFREDGYRPSLAEAKTWVETQLMLDKRA